ncbi:type II toxin-antitoxin system HipA family toxin [Homoserinibacter sp. GY 40078]|uniref:type II toxin-antitoxin system HipA family toxin n=1 Tax=Homoserinibacter sp. GY 40078 TaxID=2603275 RepID=UPI0011C706FC|nr:type II toxin-antitoxin system HipA family toxin [Homoserinibacter sp. GY 40078]TXK18665.1 type II toxin-antitoxin system HipA family toxin [Homoserinibacter sp. GY 40078]
MTVSELRPGEVYVWTWLPGDTSPVVAGIARTMDDGRIAFAYAESYRERSNAISLYAPELPLGAGTIEPIDGLTLPGALRDASPDAWGRNVIHYTHRISDGDIDELGYLLLSGSNRFGALDFQASPREYVPRADTAALPELVDAASRLADGLPIDSAAAAALEHGTTIGGARPKVLARDDDGFEWIVKLSAQSDTVFSVVRAEAACMHLAGSAGIRVPEIRVERIAGRDALLVRRFDRTGDGGRRHVVSGLTMVELDENLARYATYPGILDRFRTLGGSGFIDPGPEVFERIAFNIAIGNSDDHARNHAAFWDGGALALTPAYDLAPGNRSGEMATQAMAFDHDGVVKVSQFAALVGCARVYGLEARDARARVERIVDAIRTSWDSAVDFAEMSRIDRDHLWGRQILNPFAFYGF